MPDTHNVAFAVILKSSSQVVKLLLLYFCHRVNGRVRSHVVVVVVVTQIFSLSHWVVLSQHILYIVVFLFQNFGHQFVVLVDCHEC